MDVERALGNRHDLGQWVSARDLAQLFCKSVEAPNIEDEYGIPFQVFYGVSANTRSAWSIANAWRIIGYERWDGRSLTGYPPAERSQSSVAFDGERRPVIQQLSQHAEVGAD